MQIELAFGKSGFETDAILLPAYQKPGTGKNKGPVAVTTHWPKDYQNLFKTVKGNEHFKGNRGDTFSFTDGEGHKVFVIGMGEKTKAKSEVLRREIAKAIRGLIMKTSFNYDLS